MRKYQASERIQGMTDEEVKHYYDEMYHGRVDPKLGPFHANMWLLLWEMRNPRGQAVFKDQKFDKQLEDLFKARFETPDEYAFKEKPDK